MVKVRAGDKKKALILQTCKKLFYEKGYNATTYEDICRAADVPPGSITYHFTNKKNIAAIIHTEYELKVKTMMNILTKGIYDVRTMSALELINWWDRYFNNPELRRFITEITDDGIPRISAYDSMEYFYSILIKEYKLNIDEKRFKFIIATHIGLISEILLMVSKDLSKYTPVEIADYVIENSFKFLNIDYETIENVIKEASSIYEELKIDNRYFEYFEYDESAISQ